MGTHPPTIKSSEYPNIGEEGCFIPILSRASLFVFLQIFRCNFEKFNDFFLEGGGESYCGPPLPTSLGQLPKNASKGGPVILTRVTSGPLDMENAYIKRNGPLLTLFVLGVYKCAHSNEFTGGV
jgi:hypothetical protein